MAQAIMDILYKNLEEVLTPDIRLIEKAVDDAAVEQLSEPLRVKKGGRSAAYMYFAVNDLAPS